MLIMVAVVIVVVSVVLVAVAFAGARPCTSVADRRGAAHMWTFGAYLWCWSGMRRSTREKITNQTRGCASALGWRAAVTVNVTSLAIRDARAHGAALFSGTVARLASRRQASTSADMRSRFSRRVSLGTNLFFHGVFVSGTAHL